jgi:hypothetical protein
MTSVIVGSHDDTHVLAVKKAIDEMGGEPPLIVDAPSLLRDGFSVTLDAITVGGKRIEVGDVDRGWLRRYAPPAWGTGLVAGSLEALSRRSFLALIGSIARISGVQWLTTLDALLAAEDKLFQLHTARHLGIPIPSTIIASDPSVVTARLGEHFVVKPLSGGYYVSSTGPRVVFASALRDNEAELLSFADAPFLAQERIATIKHLRVVTVRSRAWVCALGAEGRPLDWRQQEEAHFAWTVADDEEVRGRALALSSALGSGYSSQDWIRTDDEAYFLDLNPGGQWLFLPHEVASEVTRAIASYLCGVSCEQA